MDQQHCSDTKWKEAIHAAFGSAPPTSVTWADANVCADVLRSFMTSSNSFLPESGDLTLDGVKVNENGDRLLFSLGREGLVEAAPRALRFEYIKRAPIESFFLLELSSMQPSGVYENANEFSEAVARNDGTDYDPSVLESDIRRFDENGNKTPPPRNIKQILRLLSGKLLIVSKNSMWNRNIGVDISPATMTADEIRFLIERWLSKSSAPQSAP